MHFITQKRRLAFWLVLAAAVAAGILSWGKSALLFQMIEWHWPAALGDYQWREAFLAKAIENAPPEQRASFSEDPDEILAFAKAHPGRPWHLWRWMAGDRMSWAFAGNDFSGLTLSERHAEYRRVGEEFEQKAEFLREMDPDNGWPLLLLAYLEARKGIALKAANSLGEVKEARHADQAVAYLLQAAAKDRVTWHERELIAEWQSLLGYKGGTVDEALVMSNQTLRLSLLHFSFRRDLIWLLLTEADRRASMPGEERPSAFEILRALQTLWAKIILGETRFLTITSGMATIQTVTEEGAKILRKHGKDQEADALLQRGRSLIWPWLTGGQPSPQESGEIPEIRSGPELTAKAQQLDGARRELAQLATSPSTGTLLAAATPSLTTWPTEDIIATDAFKTESRLEYWAMQKAFWAAFTAVAAVLLPLLIIFYAALQFRFRRCETYVPDAWPSPRRLVLGALIFGLVAASPGIAAAFAGNAYAIPFRVNVNWLLFCNLWGFLAAAWTTGWWAGRAGGGDVTPATPSAPASVRKGLQRRLANLPVVALALSPAFAAYFLYRKQDGRLLWSLVEILALIFAAWAGLKAVGVLRGMLLGTESSAPSPLALRLFLAGWAGGLMLWIACYGVIDRQEREWVARDTLLVPRPGDDVFTSDSALTSRLVRLLQDEMRNALDETR